MNKFDWIRDKYQWDRVLVVLNSYLQGYRIQKAKEHVSRIENEINVVFDLGLSRGYISHECDDSECEQCCEHVETDHGICIDCGSDESEWQSMDRYDSYKNSRHQ